MDKVTKGKVIMKKKDFVSEHKELLKILKKDNPKMLKKEASEQAKELKKVLAKK